MPEMPRRTGESVDKEKGQRLTAINLWPYVWWRRRELNPRPETFFCWVYMLSRMI